MLRLCRTFFESSNKMSQENANIVQCCRFSAWRCTAQHCPLSPLFLQMQRRCSVVATNFYQPTWSSSRMDPDPCRDKHYKHFYSAVLAIVNPSVRLSVRHTLVLCQYDSSYNHAVFMTLVSSRLTSPRNSKGNTGSESAEWDRGGKNRQFLANKSPYSRNGAR